MPTRTKLIVTAFVAMITLAAALSTATATRLLLDDRSVRFVWNDLDFAAGPAVIECDVTLAGSFHSNTIVKTLRSLIGHVTGATVNEAGCLGGTLDFLSETLPWHVQYNGFRGTLPAISGVGLRLVGATLRISSENTVCLAPTTEAEPALGDVLVDTATGVVDGLDAREEGLIDVNDVGTSTLCDSFLVDDISFNGTATVTDAVGAAVVIRLI